MTVLRTLLIPTDFSGCADAAVALGFDLARRNGSRVELMHVCESGMRIGDCLGLNHPLARHWRKHLNEVNPDHPVPFEWEGLQVMARTWVADDATEAILDRAAARDIDLLVMGTHGRHSVRRFLNDTPDGWSIGQTARMVLPETRCPVLAVGPQGSRMPVAVEQVVAPVDDSRHAAGLIMQAAAVARLYDVPLVVLHVLRRGSTDSERADARRRISVLVRENVEKGYPVESELAEGLPSEAIVRDASRRAHPLLVLASHGEKSRGSVQIGSVADAVTRSAPCPVLTLKPFGKSLVSVPEDVAGEKRPLPLIPR